MTRRIAAVERELVVRTSAARAVRALDRAARTGGRIVAGPFLGEVGFELEYWIPFLRRELRRRGIERERAVVITRGGAGLWYEDFAAGAVDLFELLPPESYVEGLEARRARARDLKQLRSDRFDRELIRLALARTGPATVVHPSLMFARLRGLWFQGVPPEELWHLLEFRPLEVDPAGLPGIPERFVAVKAYFNECLPPTEENRLFFRRMVERLVERVDVVLLSTGLVVDDHEEWATRHERVHSIEHLLRPEDNLAVQTRLISRAAGLVSTYGGFSYLGALLGVPTLTFTQFDQTVPVHLDVLRRAFPRADYTQSPVGDDGAIADFAARAAP